MAFFTQAELGYIGMRESMRANKSSASILSESLKAAAKELKQYDIFLSHRYMDASSILGLKELLEDCGFVVFVDWIERPELDRSLVNRETAQWLRDTMKRCKCLLYAASENARNSKWMPWEMGYSDGIHGRVAVVPVVETQTTKYPFEGQEYLALYPYLTKETLAGMLRPDLVVRESPYMAVTLRNWLQGFKPSYQ